MTSDNVIGWYRTAKSRKPIPSCLVNPPSGAYGIHRVIDFATSCRRMMTGKFVVREKTDVMARYDVMAGVASRPVSNISSV